MYINTYKAIGYKVVGNEILISDPTHKMALHLLSKIHDSYCSNYPVIRIYLSDKYIDNHIAGNHKNTILDISFLINDILNSICKNSHVDEIRKVIIHTKNIKYKCIKNIIHSVIKDLKMNNYNGIGISYSNTFPSIREGDYIYEVYYGYIIRRYAPFLFEVDYRALLLNSSYSDLPNKDRELCYPIKYYYNTPAIEHNGRIFYNTLYNHKEVL